jgi:DNA methylase
VDFDRLVPADRQRLKEDIERHGVLVPVLISSAGAVIDGIERLAIAEELHLPCAKVVIGNCTREDVAELRRSTNVYRRHLSREQIRAWIAWEIRSRPEQSDRCVAGKVGVSPTTVGRIRAGVQDGHPNARMGVDGKFYSHKPRVVAETEVQAREAQRLLEDLAGEAPSGPVRIRELRTVQFQRNRDRLIAQAKPVKLPEDFNLFASDFRKIGGRIKPDTVDLLVADPPWKTDSGFARAEFAAKVYEILKPGGICLAYSGVYSWPDFLDCYRDAGLQYLWAVSVIRRNAAIRLEGIRSQWIPLSLLRKPGGGKFKSFRTLDDVVEGEGYDKGIHPWQSPVSELVPLVRALSTPGALVCDMTLGSGTSALATLESGENRRFVGCDQDAKMIKAARSRLFEAIQEQAMESAAQ